MKRDLTALKAMIKTDYHRHIKRFSTLSEHKKMVMIGDSLVAYFPLKHYHLDHMIHNLGIPGDTTKGVLERIDQVVLLKPEKVILHIGLNDEVLLEHTVKETVDVLKQIIAYLNKELPETELIVVSLTPINQSHFPHSTYVIDRLPTFSININQALKTLEGIQYIDLYQSLVDQLGELDLSLTTDGIHLNQMGYDIYYQHVKNIL